MRDAYLWVVTILLLAPSCLLAEKPLDLKDCFKAALKRSEVLATQQESVIQAEENYRRAWGAILPTINGSYSYLHQNASGLTASGNTDSSPNQQTTMITADQPLFRGFRDFAAINASKASITAQEQARQWAGIQLYSDVAQAFYTRLSVQKDLEVLDNELELYQQRIKELQDRLAIGRSRITEVLTVQSAQAILKAQREQVLGQLNVAGEVLAFLTGLEQNIPLTDTNDAPATIASLETYQACIKARPDVIAAEKNLEASESNITGAKGAYLPTADLTGNYYLDRPDMGKNGTWDAGVAVILPLFAGGVNISNVRTAESQKRQSEMQLSLVERMAVEEIRSLYHNLRSDIAQLSALQDAFDISEKNYKANVSDYERNLVSNLEKMRYLVKIDYDTLEAAAAHRLSLVVTTEKQ